MAQVKFDGDIYVFRVLNLTLPQFFFFTKVKSFELGSTVRDMVTHLPRSPLLLLSIGGKHGLCRASPGTSLGGSTATLADLGLGCHSGC